MPTLLQGQLRIDYADAGQGQPVVLIHSSVSSNRQWHSLTEALKERYRVLAPNLFGYGETTPWPGPGPQSLNDQAELVLALCARLGTPVQLVGHSTGGSVALMAALRLGAQVERLVLLEPNPFYLLRQHDRVQAYRKARVLRNRMLRCSLAGNWRKAAEFFANYWLGERAWACMPERRQSAFIAALPPVLHEWEAVMGERTPLAAWRAVAARTLVVSDATTRLPIREIIALFAGACPHWRFHTLPRGGHMAPFTHPELVNPVVRAFLDAGQCR